MPDGKTLGFADANLNRAAMARMDPSWLAERLKDPGSRFLCFSGDRPVIDVSAATLQFARFTRQEAVQLGCAGEAVLLGAGETGEILFAMQSQADDLAVKVGDDRKLIDLRSLAQQGTMAPHELGILAQARSLLHWHERHQFCAVCGAATRLEEAGYRRNCETCEADHFPRTDPVVIIVVIGKEKCLLGRGPNFLEGVYSALAGFMEPGETMEDAARREVLEESGIKVGKVDYVLSQPWPFPSSLMIGLVGEAMNEEIIIDPQELEDARWFSAAELNDMLAGRHAKGLRTPPPMAIAHHLVIEALRRLG